MILDRLRAHPRLLALLSGLACAIAFPPFGILPGLLAWGLLFLLVDGVETDHPLRRAFLLGWLGAFAYFLVASWWVAEAFLVDAANQAWMAPFAVALLPAGLGLFWGAAMALYRRLRPGHPAARVALFAALLSLAEWLRGNILTGFPWNLPGEVWKAGSAPSQFASVVGAYGMTFLTLLAAAAVVHPVAVGRNRRGWSLLGGGAAIIIGLYAFGLFRLAQPLPPRADAPVVRIVQANIPQEAKYDQARFTEIFQDYVRLTATPAARPPDIVVWPEGAIPDSANDYLAPGTWTADAIAAALRPGQTLLVGAYRVEGPPSRYFNSLLALRRDADGLRLTGLYDKFRLVPFGEYMPAESLMSRLGIPSLLHIGEGFSSGPRPRPIAPQGLPLVQPLICYESLYPGFTSDGARLSGQRAQWIVNVSNDAWFGRTSGPLQHLNLASYRAIEEGLPLIRATPTGVSAVIDARGRVLPGARLGMGQAGVVDRPLPAAAPVTVYARFGDLFFWFMNLAAIAGCGFLSFIGRYPRRIVSIAN